MIKYVGNSASGGLAVGKIKVINRRITGFKRVVLATHRERALLEAAFILAKDELRRLMQPGDRQQQDILLQIPQQRLVQVLPLLLQTGKLVIAL